MRIATEKPESLEDRIAKRIARKRSDVFLRADFRDLGTYGEIGHALRSLVQKGRLMKFGHGIYVRAKPSLLDGKLMPVKGSRALAAETLKRLDAEITESRADRAYNSGRSEQVPTGRVVGIRGKRVRRKLGYDGIFLKFERAGPDRPEPQPKAGRSAVVPMPPITVGEALRLIWEADHCPILGNEDWRTSAALEKEAYARAAMAETSPDDPPEFAPWLATLLDQTLPPNDREAVMSALYDLFDPEGT